MGTKGVVVAVDPGQVPEPWRGRAELVALIRLDDGEALRLFESLSPPTDLPEDEEFLRLVASGHPTRDIARLLGLSRRTVERRIADLRERFEVETTPQLVALLTRRGVR